MKHIFIINPAAGKGVSQGSLSDRIRSAAEKCKADFEIYHSKGIGDALHAVRGFCEKLKDRPVRFYACGGDGTVNEVASGTVGYENAEFGVVPVGTGNDFVKNFEIADSFMDIERQICGSAYHIDAIRVNDRYSVNLSNMGFDCSVVERVAKIKRHPWISSGFAYVAGVIAELIKLPGVRVKRLVLDGEEIDKKELLLCAFGNGGYYGGGFHCAPEAELDDGFMDVFYAGKISRLQFISMVGSYKKGTYLENKRIMRLVSYHKCRSARIDFENEQSVCLDGEIHKFSSLEIEIVPRLLRLALPEGVRFPGTSKAAEALKI